MRLSDKYYQVIEKKEKMGYVWLSHLSLRAQMRFRDRTKRGFSKFVKENGLTFLTKELASYLELTSRSVKMPRMKVSDQLKVSEAKLADAGQMLELIRKYVKWEGNSQTIVLDINMTADDYEKIRDFVEKGTY